MLFFALFKLLAEPHGPPARSGRAALLGAVGFEILKQVSTLLLASTKGQPAFQAFGIALILLVWINYFSRLVLYAAAWAYTTPEARALRQAEPADPVQGPVTPDLTAVTLTGGKPGAVASKRPWWFPSFAAGSGATLALVALIRRRKNS